MSYHAPLYEIWVQIYINISAKWIFTKSQNLMRKLTKFGKKDLHTFKWKKDTKMKVSLQYDIESVNLIFQKLN